MRRFWWLLRRSVVEMYEDGGLGVAKGAAYSALLAFFPLLTTTATLLVHANAESVSRIIAQFLFEVVPPGSQDLVRFQFAVRGERPAALLVLASLVTVWAASGFMVSLMDGFQAAYHIPRGRPIVAQRAVAILLVVAAAAPAIAASALLLIGERVQVRILEWLGLIRLGEQLRGPILWLWSLARIGIALATTVLVTGLVYRMGPNRRQKIRLVWPGALVATGLWLVTTAAFGWYVRNMAGYNVLYGSIGAVIALLVWMYLVAVIALVGCEFNAASERLAEAGQ